MKVYLDIDRGLVKCPRLSPWGGRGWKTGKILFTLLLNDPIFEYSISVSNIIIKVQFLIKKGFLKKKKKAFSRKKKGFKTIKKLQLEKKGFTWRKTVEKKDFHKKRFSTFFNVSWKKEKKKKGFLPSED